jgi:ABC-type oligopeptide transport system ATPase subunit
MLSGKTTLNAKIIFLRKYTKGKLFIFNRYFKENIFKSLYDHLNIAFFKKIFVHYIYKSTTMMNKIF